MRLCVVIDSIVSKSRAVADLSQKAPLKLKDGDMYGGRVVQRSQRIDEREIDAFMRIVIEDRVQDQVGQIKPRAVTGQVPSNPAEDLAQIPLYK